MNDLTIFILGVVTFQVLKMLALSINQAVIERRQKRFLVLVNGKFAGAKSITYVTFDTSDKRAMRKIARQLQEDYPDAKVVRDDDDLPKPQTPSPMTKM